MCQATITVAGEHWAQEEQNEIIESTDHFYSSNIKEQEVLDVWKMYFHDWGIEYPKRKRSRSYREYAKWIVKWVNYYETFEGAFGGRLPMFEDNHILVAVIIQKETGIDHTRRGRLGEVGLMQVWGEAQQGYPSKQILENPEIGIILGIQWLAYTTTLCKNPGTWTARTWLKPLTQYIAGPKASVKGKCKIFGVARRRVNKVVKYRRRIDQKNVASL
jgi:soluble lytic murein transglycosylase-like protein